MADNNEFQVNEWFNELPIRIVGSHEEPFFYAKDIATILGIKNVTMSISNFDETDVVTPEKRQQYKIKTYKMNRGKLVEDSNIVLLTEYGVYRLIMQSRTETAKPFKKFIVEIVKKVRLQEVEKLKTINEKLIAETNDLKLKLEHQKSMEKQIKQLDEYKNVTKCIYVFSAEIDNADPYDHLFKKDLDEYFMNEYKPIKFTGKLFKYTYSPTAQDYNNFSLVGKIYTPKDVYLFDELSYYDDQELNVDQRVLSVARYYTDLCIDDIEEVLEETKSTVVMNK